MSTGLGPFGQGWNPPLPSGLHIPDGEARRMPDGRLYVYGSWDQQDDGFCSSEYCVVSTADLVEWTDHGCSFDVRRVPWTATPDATRWPGLDWTRPTSFMERMLAGGGEPATPVGGLLYAPDAVHRDGRYFLYFCGSDESEGVAVADRPEGPFDDAVQLPCGGIDPAVLVDDDGGAYFYWGQFSANGVQLTDNMTSFVPGTTVEGLLTEEEHHFHEGTSIRRIGDLYYAVYASIERGAPTTLSYATATSPLGPFEHRGVVIDNARCDPWSWNNHGSIERFGDRWYVFYHRSSRRSMSWRRLCIEPISFDDEGAIAEVPMTTQGPGRPLAAGDRIDGWRACEVAGGAFVGPGESGREGLAMPPGSAAVFRWLELDRRASSVELEMERAGIVALALGRDTPAVGAVEVWSGRGTGAIVLPPGRHELWLRNTGEDDVVVLDLVLR